MSLMFALLLVSAQAPDAQQAPAPAATAAAAPAKKVKQKKICKVQDAESGSHMSKRVCLTENEWELEAQGANLTGKQIQTDTDQN
jgi:hypothetical protein